MKNPHIIFIGIAACSILLTFGALLIQDSQSIASMLTILLPIVLGLTIVLIATRKFWINARAGGG